jgi:hypothetical protein
MEFTYPCKKFTFMKKTLLIAFIALSVFSCDKDEKEVTPPPTKTELLTGGTQKSWSIFSQSPEPACSSSTDDRWTFFSDGTFQYDRGTVTESEDGECSDLINFEGSWAFESAETKITIIALRPTGSTDEIDPLTVASGTLTELTSDRLIITAPGSQGSVELRKK